MAERPWSWSTGHRGVNRVRVYERYVGGPIQVEWRTKDGRVRRETLRNLAKVAIRDKKLAMRIAEAMSVKQREAREADAAAQVLGLPVPRTIKELLDELHKQKKGDWSAKHKKDQERFQAFWLDALGRDTVLADITPALAAEKVRVGIASAGRSARTQQAYLRYLKDAFIFAQTQLKWITEEHNLSALKMPQPNRDNTALAYSLPEVFALLEALRQVDLRAAAIGEILVCTGKRLDVTRTRRVGDYDVQRVGGREVATLRFPARKTKQRVPDRVPLSAEARELVEMLLSRRAVQTSGYLFPAGELDEAATGPMSPKTLTDWLHKAEEIAEIEQVPGRAWHAFKRAFATMVDLEAAAAQSQTLRTTLESVYRQDRMDLKLSALEQVAEHRRALDPVVRIG